MLIVNTNRKCSFPQSQQNTFISRTLEQTAINHKVCWTNVLECAKLLQNNGLMVKRKMSFCCNNNSSRFWQSICINAQLRGTCNMLRLATSYISMCFLTSGEIYCNHFIWVGMTEFFNCSNNAMDSIMCT